MRLSRLSSRVLWLCPGSAEFRPGDHEAAARIAEARVAIQYHAAETALFAEAALLQFCGNAGPLLRDIEEKRPVDARQRRLQQGDGGGLVIGGQRPDLSGQSARPCQQDAFLLPAACPLRRARLYRHSVV